MRQPAVALAVALICAVASGCATTGGRAVMPSAITSMIPRPLVERELPGLLLTVEQVNAAMGATAMAVTNTETSMSDNSATMAPPECLPLDGAAEAAVYANSGFQAELDQSFNDGDQFTHYLKQAVVLFSLVDTAAAFVNDSALRWRACQQYTHLQSNSQWSVGPIEYADGTLSTTVTELNAAAPGWGCGRAMSLKNNVVIDINTCSANPADSALKIANQIAQNVAARW
ncbi:sensor domain-containing protein [Mycobacterium sp. NPDC048908]|uniref:sensor domain-containing protein n=1 Tax=Mycobacterium sp. NPDC048908 TaxID=3364292 RepID=UPI00371E65BE